MSNDESPNGFWKFWHDSVWSKVIAAAIVGLGAYTWAEWVPLIFPAAGAGWKSAITPIPVPALALALVGLYFCVRIVKFMRARSKGATVPDWHEYTSDLFFGIRWAWQWSSDAASGPERLSAFCPKCSIALDPSRNWRPFALEAGYQVVGPNVGSFACDHCGHVTGAIHENPIDMKAQVIRLIGRNITTGEWRKLTGIRSQAA